MKAKFSSMPKPLDPTRSFVSFPVITSCILVSVAGSLSAQTTYSWRNEAGNGNWNDSNNWWNGSGNSVAGFGVLFFDNNNQLTMDNNMGGVFSTHALVFGANASNGRTISGDAIQLHDNGGADPSIQNNSSATHILNLSIEGDGTDGDPLKIQLNGSGGLTFGGTINNQGSFVNVEGSGTGGTVTFNSTISGGGGLYKAGAGVTADLMVGNSYSGDTLLAAGTLRAASDTAFGSVGVLKLDGGTIASASSASRSFANQLSQIGGNVTFGQSTGGTGSLLFSSTAATTLNNGTRTLTIFQATELRGALGNGNLTKEGSATLTLNNGSSSFGALTINAGTVSLADSATVTGLFGSGGLQLAIGKTLTVNAGSDSSFSGTISGQGALIKLGSAKSLTLAASNTFSGGVHYGGSGGSAGGILSLAGSSSGGPGGVTSGPLGTGDFTIRNNSSTTANNYIQSSDSTARTISNAIVFSGSGIFANFGGTGDLVFDGGVSLGSGVRGFNVNNGKTTFSGVIAGASDGAVTKGGSGTLVFSGNNSYAGGTTLYAGTLQLGDGGTTGNAGSGAFHLSGGTLAFNRNDSPIYSNTVNATGGGNRFIEVASGTSATLSGVVTGVGEFWKSGAGTLVLSNTSNSFSASVVIQSGTLRVNSMSNLGGSGNLFIGQGGSGTFSYNGSGAESTGKLGDYAMQGGNSNTIEILQTSANLTVTSNIGENTGGAKALTKTGNGILTLTGSNSYTGGTNVNAGTLVVNGSLASGAVSVASGAKLKGGGTIGGDLTLESNATHSPGNSPGVQTVNGNLKYKTGSIFEWELVSNLDGDTGDSGDTGVAGTDFDAVAGNSGKTLTVESAAIFNIIFNVGSAVNFNHTFWASNQKWTVFSGFQSVTGLFSLGSVSVDSLGKNFTQFHPAGGFSFSSSGGNLYLNWTAVPETGTLATGFLLGIGLWSRRRNRVLGRTSQRCESGKNRFTE